LLLTDPALLPEKVDEISERYAKTLGVSPKDLRAAAERSRERLVEMTRAMGLQVATGSPARRLLEAMPDTMPLSPNEDSLTPHALQATVVLDDRPAPVREGPPPAEMLAAGIQDITNSMVSDGFRLNEVLRMILETMYRALGFRRVIFCLRDPKTHTLTGRFGLGDNAPEMSAAFKVPLRVAPGEAPGLFTAVCLKGVDTVIADATAANMAARLPAWYRERVNAPAFLLLPLVTKNAPFALIYADKAEVGGIALDEKELSLVRTLRNQAVMAFRQVG
jgi:hypothetical protein